MPNELSEVFGLCCDCIYFFLRDVSNDEEDGCEVRCLITDTNMEDKRYTNRCSHYETNNSNKRSLFLTDYPY